MTPHIEAKLSQIADTVLMPGDPLRAKWIATTFLDNFEQINSVRNMLGYTGFYKKKRITVFGSGMGMPSIGIYAYELFQNYKVKQIIRVGTAGAYDANLNLQDIILARKAWSNSTFAQNLGIMEQWLAADPQLISVFEKTSKQLNHPLHSGFLHSEDNFYGVEGRVEFAQKNQLLAVEMEAFGLYATAQFLQKKAVAVCAISDSLVNSEKQLSSAERQKSLNQLVYLCLESSLNL